ncbi:hypothetical protein AYO22_04003 [Fonsecaea multimorphosa]|nr:hypothetical protein AYO22_04003 [Fonsecaea multimorphosa]
MNSPRTFSTAKSLLAKPVSIQATLTERSRGKLSEQNLEKAVRQVRHDGLVIVQNAIDTNVLRKLNEKMVEDALELRSKGENSPFNYNQGNLQQDAPPVREYFQPEIFLSNSAMPPRPGSPPERQPVHSDADFAHPDHPFALVVNVPLIDMRPENGSTEVWLGTHNNFGIEAQEGAHGERASGRIHASLLAERSKTNPPIQPFVPSGSIIVRDLRLWHAGMPNTTSHVRIMLAMIHFAPWYRNQMRLELAEEIKPLVESVRDLDIRADFVREGDALKRYLNRGFGNSYDFGQSP